MNRSQVVPACLVAGVLWIALLPTTAAGQLLVGDYGYGRIHEFGFDGSYNRLLTAMGYGHVPAAMALGNGNDLYVADEFYGSVLRYDWRTGELLGTFATGLAGPGGLLFDRARNQLLVGEMGNDTASYSFTGETIARFDATSGALLGRFGAGTGITPAQGGATTGEGRAAMLIGADQNLYVSSYWDSRVLRFRYDNATANWVPNGNDSHATFADAQGGLLGTNGLVFDPSGKLDVVGMWSNNVFQFAGDGTPMGELIPHASYLFFPSAALIDPAGNLLVSSMGDPGGTVGQPTAGYIGHFDFSGNPTAQAPITLDSSFSPSSMLALPARTAKTWSKGGSSVAWSNGANWGPAGVPTSTCDATFTNAGLTDGDVVNLGGDQTANSVIIDGSKSFTLGGTGGKLTLANGYLSRSAASSGTQTIACPVVLGANAVWDIDGAGELSVSGPVSGEYSLEKRKSGTLVLSGPNSYTGGTYVTAGTLVFAGAAALPAGENLTAGAGAVVVFSSGFSGVLGSEGGPQGVSAVPEPGTALLAMAGGLTLLAVLLRRRGL
jgi:autotransporter-associated beta strand protein